MGANDDVGAQDNWSPGLRAVVDHLWNPLDGFVVTPRRAPYQGYRELDSYLVVPSVARAKFLVPLTAGRATAAATLRAYNRLRPKRVQVARGVVAAGVRAAVLPIRSVDRLRVLVPGNRSDAELATTSPRHWLADQLGAAQFVMALAVPPATPNSKPTLQLFTPGGVAVAYAKLGWNDSTSSQLRNEAAMSSRFGPVLRELYVPPVLLESSWRGFTVVVTQAMPADAVAWGMQASPPPLSVTEDVLNAARTYTCPLADSPLVRRLSERLGGEVTARDSVLREALSDALLAIRARWDSQPLRHGAWHGDWVPWNLARNGDQVIAWDWEHSREDTPAGFDLLHWHFQLAFIHEGKALTDAIREMRQAAAQGVAALQHNADAVNACVALYTLELSARYLAMHEAGAGWNARFYPAIVETLRDVNST
jgi:hypothetical protein